MTSDDAILSSNEEFFPKIGYVGPVVAIEPGSCLQMANEILGELGDSARLQNRRGLLHRIQRRISSSNTQSKAKYNRHFDWPLIERLTVNRAILDAVEDVIGPHVILWRTNIFCQYASDSDGLPWHRDAYESILVNPERQVSVQIALTKTTRENCLEIVPGSHAMSDAMLANQYGWVAKKVGHAGNTHYSVGRPHSVRTKVVLNPGEFILFHPDIIHRSSVSPPKEPVAPRVCVTLRYTVPGNVNQVPGAERKCALVRGEATSDRNNLLDWREKGAGG